MTALKSKEHHNKNKCVQSSVRYTGTKDVQSSVSVYSYERWEQSQ